MLLLAGCSKSDIEEVNTSIGAENPTFYASLEGGDETRTYLDENLKMRWHNDDRITVFCGNDNNAEYAFTGKTGATAGDFQLIVENQTGTGESVWRNYALYPHSSATKFVSTGPYGYIEYTIPATQHYVEGTFAPNTNLMAAVTETPEERRLQFKNVCGYLKLDLYGNDVTVKEITLRDNYGGPLAGAVRVEFAYRRDPMLTWEGTVMSDALTLDCGEGVKIGTTKETATSFYLVVPPTEFPGGFSVTITDTKGGTMTQTTEKAQEIKRNTVKSMAPFKVETIVWEEVYAAERNALIEFYKALGGDNWAYNTNWCSDKPVGEWYGVFTDEQGLVQQINLIFNNLVGAIPNAIKSLQQLVHLHLRGNPITNIPTALGDLPCLEDLDLSMCEITKLPDDMSIFKQVKHLRITDNKFDCEIPESIGTLTNLEVLELGTLNRAFQPSLPGLKGPIPESIGNLTNLEILNLSWNLLTGEIPASLGNLVNLEQLVINANRLVGKVPESVMQLDCWPSYWSWIINQDCASNGGVGISKEGLVIPAPQFSAQTIDGETLDNSVYAKNEYTVLYHYFNWCPYSNEFTPQLVKLYNGYKDKGLEVIAFSDEGSIEYHSQYANSFKTEWPYLLLDENNRGLFYSYIGMSPYIDVVDKNGYVVFNHIHDNYAELDKFLLEKLGEPDDTGDEPEYYESTDYSQDGKVTTLQTAKQGRGIDIVLMGDAYSDRLIADGTYEADMKYLYNNLFTEEPYKSFKDYFNVYYVNVVSKNDIYASNSSTKLEGYFGEGTHVGGKDATVFSYAQNAITADQMDEALLIVVMNSNAYAGTCYMYYPTSGTDYGSGVSVSYFPKGSEDATFAQLLHHEACGHGFAKLADEYAYAENGTIPSDEVLKVQDQQTRMGWLKNIDFTSDPYSVRWSTFLSDSRYANEGLGVFEGGFTYWSGVWRPTINSIMHHNTGGFNAPSREAIYYRIHKLAYGAEWQYDYEKFVEWDARNRAAAATRAMIYRPAKYQPTPPPVVINRSWRDAK